MTYASSPLEVIINPPEMMQLTPGSAQTLSVVVTNRSRTGAIVETSLELPPVLRPWCKVARESFNLGPGNSQEILFEWQIPDQAPPNPPENPYYEYVLMVDAPTNNFLTAPLLFTQRLQILMPQRKGDRSRDPTFTITPATRSTKPAEIQPGVSKLLQIEVHNRSRRVDDYRVTCPDLDDDWYVIRYPEAFETLGTITGGTGLRLNPNTTGLINVEIRPPAEAFAGNYSPTIRVHSAVDPDLLLQDIVYLAIPPHYDLKAELTVILDRVKQKAGQYELFFSNQGNTTRRLKLFAETADEDELCEYRLQANQLLLPPGRAKQVGLEVQPLDPEKQPVGLGRQLTFWVKVEDVDGYELPKNVPIKGSLFWEARPIWRRLLRIILMVLGGVVLVALLIWLIFFRLRPTPAQIEGFRATDQRYVFPEAIGVEWAIKNPKQLSGIQIRGVSEGLPPITIRYDEFTEEGIPVQLENRCGIRANLLECRNVPTEARETGDYQFEISITSPVGNSTPEPQTLQATIEPPPAPELQNIMIPELQLGVGEPIQLEWQIVNLDQVAALQIRDEATGTVVREYSREQLRQFRCRQDVGRPQLYRCKGLVPDLEVGEYVLQLDLVVPDNAKVEGATASIGPVRISRGIPVVNYFAINGSVVSPVAIQQGETAAVRWNVAGDVQRVRLTGVGQDLPPEGQVSLGPFSTSGRTGVILTGIKGDGTAIELGRLDIEVLPPDAPSPTPTPEAIPTQPEQAAQPAATPGSAQDQGI